MSAVAFSLLLLVSIPAWSADGDAASPGWGVSLGLIDVTRSQEAAEVGVDYRFRAWRRGLVPHVGVHYTRDESSYLYFGLRRPFGLGATKWWFTPSFAVSLYEKGDGKELGGVVEFRSGGSFTYPVGRTRLGIGYYHLSNAGIYRRNPGTNSLLLRVLLP